MDYWTHNITGPMTLNWISLNKYNNDVQLII